MKKLVLVVSLLVILTTPLQAESLEAILNESGVKGGLIVHLGCGNAESTTALRRNERYLVHGLDTDKTKIETARKRLISKGA